VAGESIDEEIQQMTDEEWAVYEHGVVIVRGTSARSRSCPRSTKVSRMSRCTSR
jgi:hypothetical protein